MIIDGKIQGLVQRVDQQYILGNYYSKVAAGIDSG